MKVPIGLADWVLDIITPLWVIVKTGLLSWFVIKNILLFVLVKNKDPVIVTSCCNGLR